MGILELWTTRLANTSTARRDLALAGMVVLLLYFAAWRWNLAEFLHALTSRYEFMQLDELPLALFAAALALSWFSRRRMQELQTEVEKRMLAEQNQAALLAENRALARHARQAQEDERRRMARELHDDMGQYLAAIRLSAAILPMDGDPLVAEHAARIASHAEHIQAAVRNLLHQLRPVALDEYGLMDAVRHLAGEWVRQHPQTACHLALDDSCPSLGDSLNIVAYRIIQEALTNVARHAKASRVDIAITVQPPGEVPMLHVSIRDNGAGFQHVPSGPRFGLAGMRERVEAAGGTFTLRSNPGAGVAISAQLPLPARETT